MLSRCLRCLRLTDFCCAINVADLENLSESKEKDLSKSWNKMRRCDKNVDAIGPAENDEKKLLSRAEHSRIVGT